MKLSPSRLAAVLVVACMLVLPWRSSLAEDAVFAIGSYIIEGNTLFSDVRLRKVVQGYAGERMTANDVESARAALEKFHHEQGYPTVFVNIPEQSVEYGVVTLQVVEARIEDVRVKGNQNYTGEYILDRLKSLRPGKMIHVPTLQKELGRLNGARDMRATPVILPGSSQELLVVELNVEDKTPFHGSLELSNRNTHDTTALRMNGSLSYDNLWQAGHSATLQYQTSPEDPDEVKSVALSYVLPSPWKVDHLFALYSVWSDSATAFGEGFRTVGKGKVLGARYVIPLPDVDELTHSFSVGLDYKDFEDNTLSESTLVLNTPIQYVPLVASYNGTLPDSGGTTRFDLSANFLIRQFMTDRGEFERKRYDARANFVYLRGGVERLSKLPIGFNLLGKVDGQLSDQPLISNEEYAAGGMDNVRGFKESEFMGDSAMHLTFELANSNLEPTFDIGGRRLGLTPFIFHDYAALWVQDVLESEKDRGALEGAGFGVRGALGESLRFEVDVARALSTAGATPSGATETYFKVQYHF